MPDAFWTSTGDIRHAYEPVQIISSFVFVPAPAFGRPDLNKAFHDTTADLIAQAQKLGANGVIWINFSPSGPGQLGYGVFAWGTAVKVSYKPLG
jgi:hypothetical protein